jgi:cephalosporin hydroxylase
MIDDGALAATLDTMTLRGWIQRYQDEVVLTEVRYRGAPTWKNVLDLWVYQEIIWELEIDTVVEIGVKHGGTTRWLSDLLHSFVGDRGRVIAVDRQLPSGEFPTNVTFVEGDSVDAATVARVRDLCGVGRVLVIADGNHAAAHVHRELELYSPLVAVGSYFIAEDGIVDVMDWHQFTPGPAVAARQFVSSQDDFEIDRSREKFLITYCPDGFVRRLR